MAYETYSKLKQMVANRRNKTDENTADTVRDNAIIDACKQIYADGSWSFLKKRTTLNVVAGVANLPADYYHSYGLKAFSAVTGTANDHPYEPVDPEDLDLYTTGDYVYWVNYDATNKVYVFNSNQTTDTVTIIYRFQPADLSNASDTTPIPDPWAIIWLATALWWSATEHEEDLLNNPFYPKYLERIDLMKANDAAHNSAPKAFRNQISELGNNMPSTSSVRR